jgi:hypothetical protein
MSRRENDLSPDSIEGFESEKGEGHFKQFMCQKMILNIIKHNLGIL